MLLRLALASFLFIPTLYDELLNSLGFWLLLAEEHLQENSHDQNPTHDSSDDYDSSVVGFLLRAAIFEGANVILVAAILLLSVTHSFGSIQTRLLK